MLEFDEFKKIRYEARPWDYSDNPYGFGNYAEGKSDISAHLPFLEYLASECNHVTEFGTRDCFSTVAFLSGTQGKAVSYDIQTTDAMNDLQWMNKPRKWEFHQRNTIDPNLEIEMTDFLFLDTLHTYKQVQQELLLHNMKVKRWIGFHDTFSQWKESLDVPGEEGIGRAIHEFLKIHAEWEIIYNVNFNHGLMIIERKGVPF